MRIPLPFVLLAFLVVASRLVAQSLAPSAAGKPGLAVPDEPITLNPFVISVGTDDGYAPTETLSGTRLKSPVKDVPSAISIVSADMLADLGALNFNDVLDFLPSTARYQSNEGDVDNNGQRTGNPFTVRGFRSDSLTTNFFTALTPIDSYNTSRLTFTRGPNSILFGVGNPGGGLDIVTNRPDLKKNSHSLSLRVDSFDSYRATLDSNFVLIPKKLGVRLDLLQEDRRRYITPTKSERGSIFLAATYQPFPATTVTVNGESTRVRNQIGRSVVTYDQYTPWQTAGSPLKPIYGNTAATNGLEFTNGNGYLVVVEGQSVIAPMNWRASAIGTRYRVNGALNNRVSFAREAVVPLNRNLGGDGDSTALDSSNASIFIQQAIGRKLFIEVAGKFEHQYLDSFEGMSGTDNTVRVDANAQLPNGQPNSMVGKPYVETSAAFWVKRPTDDAQGRITASYEVDLNQRRILNRRLGTLTFGALFNYERLHQLLDNAREINVTPLLTTGTFGRFDNAVNNIHRRTYLVAGADTFTTDWAPINAGGIRSNYERVRATPRDNISETKALVFSTQANLLENLLVGTIGVRRDRVTQEQGVFERDARGVFPDVRGATSTLTTQDRGRTYSYGAVLNATKVVSLFANRATNFVPSNQSVVNIDGIPAAPIEGEGYDVGIKFTLLGGKLQGSIDRFSATQNNVTDNTLSGQKRNAINAIWDAVDLNRVPNPQWNEFKSTRTTGYEFQLVGNPTSNLRLMFTGSKNITTVADRGARLFAYIERNLPEWRAKAATAVNSTLGATVGELATLVTNEAANDKLSIGIRQTRSSEWQFSGVGRYRFDPAASRLKGFAVGTAFLWRDEPVIGYRVRPGSPLFDITQPFYGAKTFNLDAWVDYSRALWQRRVRWEAQLRVQNVLNNRTVAPWTALDDGTGGRFVEQRLLPSALGVSLSSTFRF